jgi:hypothetical protein
MWIDWHLVNGVAMLLLVLGVTFLLSGAVGFFMTNRQDVTFDRQRKFEALESQRWAQTFHYIALDVYQADARRLMGINNGTTKNVYFVQLADGSLHTEGSRVMLKPVQIDYHSQDYSVLMFQTQHKRRCYRVQLDQATYQLLLTSWFKPLQAVA